VRFALEHVWTPVGSGVQPRAETRFLADYLLSGPDPIAVTRANLTLVVAAISGMTLTVLWYRGALDFAALQSTLVLAPFYYAGLKLGILLFPRFDERRFRRFTLVLLASVSTVLLFL